MNIYNEINNVIIHETSVDFVLRPCFKEIHVVQFDKTLPVVKVELFKNGEKYIIPDEAAINIRFGKLDHTFVMKPVLGCNEEKTAVYFDVDEQMTVIAGRVSPVLEMVIGSNIAYSSPIGFVIDKNPVQMSDVESATVVYPVIYELIGTVNQFESRISALESQLADLDSLESRVDTLEGNVTAWNAKYDKPITGIPASDLAETYVIANNAITAGTHTKITYDAKGLVTAGSDLATSDIPDLDTSKITSGTFAVARIPNLSASKITSGTFSDARIASAAVWNAKSDANNIQNGTGTNAVSQKMADATVNFTGRNPNAESLDNTLSATISTGASGSQSSAFGKNTMALATASFTNGNKTLAKGEESHAEGYQSVTLGDGSHAEGARTTAVGLQSHSEGSDTIANGEASHAEGHSTKANEYYAHAEGEDTIASGHASHAEGEASKATALSSHAEGTNNYIGVKPQDGPGGGGEVTPSQPSGYVFAAGESAHAEGFDNFVYGAGSHAEGTQNVINGTMSHAEGVKNTIGDTDGAHAEGYQTTVTGTYAHAEGQLTKAEGYASHAEGTSTRAVGTCSHAEGATTTAYANFSHTMGTGTYAGNESMLAIGKYNNNILNTLFVVGNGTADNARSNAFEVYQDGHAEVGLMGTTINSVATKGYVDGLLPKLYKHIITHNQLGTDQKLIIFSFYSTLDENNYLGLQKIVDRAIFVGLIPSSTSDANYYQIIMNRSSAGVNCMGYYFSSTTPTSVTVYNPMVNGHITDTITEI